MQRRKLIGEILVEHGWVTPEDVNTALKQQAQLPDHGEAGSRTLGAILVEMGKVTNDQIREALEEQGKAIHLDTEPVVSGSGVWNTPEHESVHVPQPDAEPAQASSTARSTSVGGVTRGEPAAAGVRAESSRPAARSNTMDTQYSEPRNDPSWRPGADTEQERRGMFGMPWLQYVIVPTVVATAIMFGVRWYLGRRRKRASRLAWVRNQINQLHIPDEITDRFGKN
jgi:hypothetical protein